MSLLKPLKDFSLLPTTGKGLTIPIIIVDPETYMKQNFQTEDSRVKKYLRNNGFEAKAGQTVLVPNDTGERIERVVTAVKDLDDLYNLAAIPANLPPNDYIVQSRLTEEQHNKLALAWAMASYSYKDSNADRARLRMVGKTDIARVRREADATYTIRDLINTPPNLLGPRELGLEGMHLMGALTEDLPTKEKNADLIKGKKLKAEYPLIHTVGAAARKGQRGRLIDFTWGDPDPDAPQISFVGKGVTFDSGGLDIKPAVGMRDMKKDMGGAAHAIALTRMIMDMELPIRLRVGIPIVENSVSKKAYRPGDVYPSRKDPLTGKSIDVEISNTDAEGRLIMADALIEMASEKPDLLIDFATLTGAQRVAHGMEIAAVMGNNKALERELEDIGEANGDFIARLPLHQRYRSALASDVADTQSSGGKAGAITAGLFLEQFTKAADTWLHFDIPGWNESSTPGRPKGGEAYAVRTVAQMLEQKYG